MLRLAASLAGDIPVQLGEAVTGIDVSNVALLVRSILHASGQRQFPRLPHMQSRLPANSRIIWHDQSDYPSPWLNSQARSRAEPAFRRASHLHAVGVEEAVRALRPSTRVRVTSPKVAICS
jgi:hypothetical protein